ncbi:hypothetical protein [Nonlabens sp. SY33080]|uniref:hypothetical protein n=1 Tax=unclassified Nonlabens TaxID=2615035 RepID=UPI001428ABD7|nr:hypothetical protein [Nonlabens sp. SY33080]
MVTYSSLRLENSSCQDGIFSVRFRESVIKLNSIVPHEHSFIIHAEISQLVLKYK